MTEETVNEAFDAVAERVEAAHQQAVADLRSKLEKAKSAALKKVSS
jgi:DNA-binding ferritin-like protein